MFRVGLSGTNWTGKTETIRRFAKSYPELSVKTFSLSSLVAQSPFPMMEEQTLEGSRWMIEQVRAICQEDGAEIQLFDRTPVDILAFTLYAENRTGIDSTCAIENILEIVRCFDIIFYLPVSNEWPLNSPSNQHSIEFARKMDSYIQMAINRFNLDIVSLPWSFDERQWLLCKYLSESPIGRKGGR